MGRAEAWCLAAAARDEERWAERGEAARAAAELGEVRAPGGGGLA